MVTISYTLPMGTLEMNVERSKVASVLYNMMVLAITKGHKFSNITIKSTK